MSETFKFPSFDHAKKDPEENAIHFDSSKHDVVIIEGLYVLLDFVPWSDLQDKVFDKTYYLDTPLDKTKDRLLDRMQKEMGLSYKDAEERVENNDLVNAQYIRTKTDLKKHEVLKIEE